MTEALVVLDSNLCELCGHQRNFHFNPSSDISTPCTYQMGRENKWDCRCTSYCKEFTPAETSPTGLICKNCKEPAFNHRSIIERMNKLRHSHAHRLSAMGAGDIPYKVKHPGMKLCCLWSIYHHMRTSATGEIQKMVPGYAIECPICQRVGRMEVVEDSFKIGPTWAWSYKKR